MKKSLLFAILLLGIAQFSAYAQNIALDKPTTSSSFQGVGYESSYANDADATNASYWSAIPAPQWWKVDLGGVYDLTSVVIRNYFDGVRYYQYNIEASTDDVTYTQIAEKTSTVLATDAGDTYPVTATARYIKVNMLFNSINPGVHISDFKAFGSPVTVNTITSGAGAGGSITPSGNVLVVPGTSQTFTMTPDDGYEISDVLVDAVSVGAVSTFTFTNVTSDHTITASFSTIPSYFITASANTGGTIDPEGDQVVLRGTSGVVYNIAAKSDFEIADVKVDDISIGAVTTYTFDDVTTNHTIAASFTVKPHLALNKTASSPDHLLEFVPALAVDEDGSNDSYWAGLAYPTTWKVDLGGAYNLNRIVIRNYVDGTRFYHYNIEASSNDVDYTQIAEKTTDDVAIDDGDSYTISTTARYLRVNMLSNSANPGVHISDFRVYGTANLTISGVTAADKVYNGTNAATLNTGSATLTGLISGDVVTLVSTGAAGTFDDKNVGTGKPVTTTGFTITGADAYKYVLTQPTVTASVTAKTLTISGLVAVSKIYNGNTTATVAGTGSLPGVISPDEVTLSGTAVATFANKNVGTGKVVTVTGLSLTGGDADNYSLTLPLLLTANITTKELTITGLTADNKVYDGNTDATLSGTPSLVGVVSPDVVDLGGTPVATFESADVADNIPVSVTGFTIIGADAGNYTLTQPQGLQANITVLTAVENINGDKFSCSVYPNPASDFVTLMVSSTNEKLSYILFDGRGNTLENKPVTSTRTFIPMQNLSSGTYFIKITDNNKIVTTIKIIKN